jgi:hypothetical protein
MDFVKRIVWFSLLACGIAWGQVQPLVPANSFVGNPTNAAAPQSYFPANHFYVYNYGATGDGVTDDSLALSSACQAAISYLVTQAGLGNYPEAFVEGTPGLTYAVGSSGSTYGMNCTGLAVWNNSGNGLSPAKLTLLNLSLRVTDPSSVGVVGIDGSSSVNISMDHVHIFSPSTNPAQKGIQEANLTGIPCCIWNLTNVQVGGYYKYTAYMNMGGESSKFQNVALSNGNTTRGSIKSWTVTNSGGTGSLSTTWTGCPISGGSGTNATAYIKTNGSGALLAFWMWNWGYGYVASDTGLTVPATGSCSGIPSGITFNVTKIISFAYIEDGANHWNVCSHWIGTCPSSQALDTQISFTQDQWFGGSIRSNTGAMWMDAATMHEFHGTYLNSESNSLAEPCIIMFDGGISNIAPWFDHIRCENNITGGVGDIWFTGTQAFVPGMRYAGDYEKGGTGTGTTSPNVFNIDPNLTIGNTGGVNFADADFHFEFANKLPIFDTPSSYTVSGKVSALVPYDWNFPYLFSGDLCLGGFLQTPYCSPNKQQFGAMDIVVPAGGSNTKAFSFSCDHLTNMTVYVGPLCNIIRASDSTAVDILPTPNGYANYGQFNSWCANTTCSLVTAYDQSGNGNNGTANTSARPAVAFDPMATNHLSVQETDATAQAISVASAAGVDGIFTNAGGSCAFVVSRLGTGTTGAFLAYKTGWQIDTNGTTNPKIEFQQAASTSALDYITSSSILASQLNVVDVEYYSASSGNAPQVRIQGTASTFSTSTSYVGTPTSDAGSALIIGNNAASGGTHSYPGGILEMDCFSGTTALNGVQLEALGRAFASSFSITTPVIH